MRVRPYLDDNVRKFPRTLEQAFGPYTQQRVEPLPPTPAEKFNHELTIVSWICIACGLAALAITWGT